MSEQNECYTFEAALDMGVKMEENGFRNYLEALRTVQHQGAREILKEAAFDELEHKHQLERALVEGVMEGPEEMGRPVPTMNLGYFLTKKALHPGSDPQEVLAFAINLEKESKDFYQRMVEGCSGTPMVSHFKRMLADETRHLQSLEDMYEEHYLTDN